MEYLSEDEVQALGEAFQLILSRNRSRSKARRVAERLHKIHKRSSMDREGWINNIIVVLANKVQGYDLGYPLDEP